MTRDLTTLEGAIDWLDLALQETRNSLDKVAVQFLANSTRNEAQMIAIRIRCLPGGGMVEIDHHGGGMIVWHGIRYQTSEPGLALFDRWLEAARAPAP